MISRSDIKQEANRITFERGEMLLKTGAVKNLSLEHCEEDGYPVVMLEADVVGSTGNIYQVTATLDEEYSEMVESWCDCPAFRKYTGLCKHCVAVLLAYVGSRDKNKTAAAGGQSIFSPARLPASGRETSYGFGNVLRYYGMQDKVEYLQSAITGSVSLEPVMEFSRNTVTLEFKIGVSHRYVLKNIGEFVKAMKNAESVSYGKKLQFIHHIDAFTERSRPLVIFLQRVVEKTGYYGSFLMNASNGRYLVCSQDSFEDFIRALGDQTIRVRIDGGEEKSRRLERRAPEQKLKIAGNTGGADITVQLCKFYMARENFYFFDEDVICQVPRGQIENLQEFLNYIREWSKDQFFVADSDLPLFCRDMLPVLEQHFELEKQDFDECSYLPETAEFRIYLDAPQRDMITCGLFAVYGEETYNLFMDAGLTEKRDTRRELMVKNMISPCFNAYDPDKKVMVLAEDEQKLFEFLSEGIPKLQQIGEVFISNSIKNIRVLAPPKATAGISLEGDLLELRLQAGEMPMDQLVEILSRYDRRKKYYRLKNGDFIHLEENGIALLAELKDELHITDAAMKEGVVTLPRYRALYLDGQLKESQGLPVQKSKDFRSLIRNMKTVEDNDFEIPESLKNTLREYQKKGFLWIKTLKCSGFGGILADDMGLGKTLQVITFLLSEMEEAPATDNRKTLIVCPASLVYNWKSEIERFAPALRASMVLGFAAERERVITEAGEREILITSYDLLKRDIAVYESQEFFCEIIDEAQFIKNHNTLTSRAVKRISAGFRLALTGTPVENRLSELWSIFDYLMPGFLYTYQRFREEMEIPVIQNQEEKSLGRLQKMIRPFILRRLKRDVLKDLPDKLEKNMYAKLSGAQEALYDAHVQRLQIMLNGQSEDEFAGERFRVLAELTKLRQICCDPSLLFEDYGEGSAKSELCLELIRNAISGGHKILLFSQFTTMLERLQEKMAAEDISYYTLTGATSKERRNRLVQKFNEDLTSVFCISLKAGGTGLNLTAADIVIHFDPWWNVAVQNQATDRAHRIGQKNVVTVYKLIARETIEEKIIKLQDMKKELADQVLGGEDLKTSSFTREELLQLLE